MKVKIEQNENSKLTCPRSHATRWSQDTRAGNATPEAVSFGRKANEIRWKGCKDVPRDNFMLKASSVILWGPMVSKDFSAAADFVLGRQLPGGLCFLAEWASRPAAPPWGWETAYQEARHRLDLDSATAHIHHAHPSWQLDLLARLWLVLLC